MNVKQLIEKLQTFDPNSIVLVANDYVTENKTEVKELNLLKVHFCDGWAWCNVNNDSDVKSKDIKEAVFIN